ncbi:MULTISPECIES: glycogen synthase [Yersinia]|uniref:Surface composition regulator n=1 Tax=Yersinia rochesterensis TaxID=1604335 RepID=A0A386HC44_9GAMM|nr:MULTISPECIES: glycogen synthase [Yersinia]AJI86788.1 glycogen synthesis family protein [Yersinia frederiksenii Y225]CNG99003.1 Glycogen synthesis protein [Yersinia kristensenii]AIN16607.1 glycogen synthesis family protein [Yersinia rochesterensis]AJJ34120.1 glycogen synthesis family protein [Yersinia rochesterensis]AYD43367.1 glycogen synthase [Yersinia rochesterensis]
MSALEKLVSAYCHTSLDFVASTVAFMENQKKKINVDEIEAKLSPDECDFFQERLAHYRDIYRPQ